jgi:hypothetical protein
LKINITQTKQKMTKIKTKRMDSETPTKNMDEFRWTETIK